MSCYTKGLPQSKYSLCISHYSDSNSSKVPPCCSPYISSLFSLSSSGTHLPFPWHIHVLSHPPANSWLRGATCLPCLCSLLCMESPVLSAPSPPSPHHAQSPSLTFPEVSSPPAAFPSSHPPQRSALPYSPVRGGAGVGTAQEPGESRRY